MQVAFEGLIGSGKTVVATAVANALGSEVILALERYDLNPFLRSFYDDQARWGLQVQIAFLLERITTLGPLSVGPQDVVADYSFFKGIVFSRVVLSESELALYAELSQRLASCYPQPELLVYLDAPTDILLDRIRARGRSYELSIDHVYLDALRRSYEDELALISDDRILRVDATQLDPEDSAQMHDLSRRLLRALQPAQAHR